MFFKASGLLGTILTSVITAIYDRLLVLILSVLVLAIVFSSEVLSLSPVHQTPLFVKVIAGLIFVLAFVASKITKSRLRR